MRSGTPYALPPEPMGILNTDCSQFVLLTYADARVPFAEPQAPFYQVRTAEQIRQACQPIGWSAIQPGDLLFFEQTYDAGEAPGPDGKLATHIGISLGAGTLRMWDAHSPGGVQLSDISATGPFGTYWQDHLFAAGRHPQLMTTSTDILTDEPDHQFTLAELWPAMVNYGEKYGFDPHVVAAVGWQESKFRNYTVHDDGTGFGLFGLDDNGMLPAFEQWSGLSVGRGAGHGRVSPDKQIEYTTMQLKRYADVYGDPILATQAWHRGGGAYLDERGVNYGNLIRAHMRTLFG